MRDAVKWRDSEDFLKRSVAWSTPDDADGDIFLVPAHGFLVDEEMPPGHGTSHGTPWTYDRQVPALMLGPGVVPTAGSEPLDQRRVAATLAALLGIEPPEHAQVPPLPGITR